MAQPYVYFKSTGKAPYNQLSNFFHAPITVTTKDVPVAMSQLCPGIREWLPATFPTSEHLWQALKARDQATFLRFTTTGDLGAWNPDVFAKTVAYLVKDKIEMAARAQKKLAEWKKKNNLGIQAKLAANPDYAQRLNLAGHMNFEREHLAADVERIVWLAILKLKFRQNAGPRAVLLSTAGKRLIEFAPGAARRPEHWGGLVTPGPGPLTVVGDNVMGNYVQAVRDSL